MFSNLKFNKPIDEKSSNYLLFQFISFLNYFNDFKNKQTQNTWKFKNAQLVSFIKKNSLSFLFIPKVNFKFFLNMEFCLFVYNKFKKIYIFKIKFDSILIEIKIFFIYVFIIWNVQLINYKFKIIVLITKKWYLVKQVNYLKIKLIKPD